jgi:hypothetical protein
MLTFYAAASQSSTFSSTYSILNKPLPTISDELKSDSDDSSFTGDSGSYASNAVESSRAETEPTHLHYRKASEELPHPGSARRYAAYTRRLTPTAELPADFTWR